jgi:hypothetical protein
VARHDPHGHRWPPVCPQSGALRAGESADAKRMGWSNDELVQVRSKRGALVLPVQVSAQVAPMQSFIAMHWGPEVLSGRDAKGEAGFWCQCADDL